VRLFNVPPDPSGEVPYTRVNHAKFMVTEQVRAQLACLSAISTISQSAAAFDVMLPI
jgi:hypothetical protein